MALLFMSSATDALFATSSSTSPSKSETSFWEEPLCIELLVTFFFLFGFPWVRQEICARVFGTSPGKGGKGKASSQGKFGKDKERKDEQEVQLQRGLRKAIEAEATAPSPDWRHVLQTWRKSQDKAPTESECLRAVVRAFIEVEPDSMDTEIVLHLQNHPAAAAQMSCVALDAIARSGRINAMEQFAASCQDTLGVVLTDNMYESLLGGHASSGSEQKVLKVLEKMQKDHRRPSARGLLLAIKGFLKNGMGEAALKQIKEMQRRGYYVPAFAVTNLFRLACTAGNVVEMLDRVEQDVAIPVEALPILFEDCMKRGDVNVAWKLFQKSRDNREHPLGLKHYDHLLKLFAAASDARVFEILVAMRKAEVHLTESLTIAILMRCADGKFLRFAEELVRAFREHDKMTVTVYSAWMKVYAYCGMYDAACDLYPQIVADGLEPDATMYGCLMKFAAECGRTELSRELFDKTPSLDIQNFLSLFRAAARDKDIQRAFTVLDQLKASGLPLHIAAYNCVLGVCVSCGDMRRARLLCKEIEQHFQLDVITYNTLLKGYCAQRDMRGAKEVLAEMEAREQFPNEISYNCLINAAASIGDFPEAWNTMEAMEKRGIKIDSYTVATMLKALKRSKNPRDVIQALELLDRPSVDVCQDEVLFITVIETCIRHQERKRLEAIVAKHKTCSLKPSMSIYCTLIRACSFLQNANRCRELWSDMTECLGMVPNAIGLGCMLDALVSNGSTDEAVKLFRKWQSAVPANKVIYSTLLKGFRDSQMPMDAMKLWREMRQVGTEMNTVVYNTVIDAQARAGAMEEVAVLVETMAEDGCQPNVITYSNIVKGYCVTGEIEKACHVLGDMRKTGLEGDTVMYNNLLDGCVKCNRMDVADRLLVEMEQHRVAPSNYTLGILVRMWGRRRKIEKALEAFETLPKRFGFLPNSGSRTQLIHACLSNRKVELAFKAFEAMKAEIGADAKAYGIMISGLVRNNWLEDACYLVEEAYGLGQARRSLPTNTTLGAEPVKELLDAVLQQGLMPTLGSPLLNKLLAAKVPVDPRLCAQFLRHVARTSS